METENSSPPPETQLKAWGSAEFDQFYIDEDTFITKKPILIPFFSDNRLSVVQIACGSQHSLILANTGQVYSLGSPDEGQLGRSGDEKLPGLVEIPYRMDMISAGESHSLACNSQNGVVYFWGVYRNTHKGKMCEPMSLPSRLGETDFKKKTISKMISGSNHSMILCNGRVYTSGDPDTGVQGRMPCLRRKLQQGLRLEAMSSRNVKDIYTGGYHAFFKCQHKARKGQDSHTCYYAWGLNNWGQLGIGTNDQTHQPTEIRSLRDKEVNDITGGEFHTIVLLKDGTMLGMGRNDDGQQADIDFETYAEKKGQEQTDQMALEKPKKKKAKRGRRKTKNVEETNEQVEPQMNMLDEDEAEFQVNTNNIAYPTEIRGLKDIVKIASASHYNYAFNGDGQAYSWGLGYNYVLGNGKEITVEEPHIVNPLFWRGNVGCISLGANHGMFCHSKDQFDNAEQEKGVYDQISFGRKKKNATPGKAESMSRASKKSVSRVIEKKEDVLYVLIPILITHIFLIFQIIKSKRKKFQKLFSKVL